MSDESSKKITDIFKKVVTTGIGAAFLTEEAVKDLLNGVPLPKEIVSGLLANAKTSKDEFITGVKSELKNYLNKIDLTKEIDRILQEYDLEIKANIKFKPKAKKKSDA